MFLKKRLLKICVLLLLSMGTAASALQLHQLDIGCANGYVLTDENTVIIIDCGLDTDSSVDSRKLFAYLDALNIDHIDAHILTHYHDDHALNMPAIVNTYGNSDTVVYGPAEKLPLHLTGFSKGSYRPLREGDTFSIGKMAITVIGPEGLLHEGNCNHDSLAFVVRHGPHRLLFTGDYLSPSALEKHREEITDVDVFQFPHHGLHPFAISDECMLAINPRLVLVPGRDALPVAKAYRRMGLDPENYSTRSGNIVIVFHDDSFEVHTHVQPGEFPVFPYR